MAISPNLRGIAAVLLATGSFVANDSCMKMAMADMPPLQVLILRGSAAILWCLPIIVFSGLGRQLPKAFNPWVVARSMSEVGAILAFVIALNMMPIADITAIMQLTPFIVLIGMWLFWGEKIGAFRMVLITMGITGALMVAQPGAATASPYAILGFLGALGAAGRDIFTRKVPSDVPALIVTFSTLLLVMLSGAAGSLLFEDQIVPQFRHLWLMLIAGFFLMCGHSFIFLAYRIAPARVVAPFSYSFLLWAGLSGYLLFDNVPNPPAILGMIVILLAGLAVIMLEGRTRQGDPKLSQV